MRSEFCILMIFSFYVLHLFRISGSQALWIGECTVASQHYFRPWETLGVKVGCVHMNLPSRGHCEWAFDQHTCGQVRELKTVPCDNSYPMWIHLPLTRRNVNKEKRWGRPTAFSPVEKGGHHPEFRKAKQSSEKWLTLITRKKIIKNWWLPGKKQPMVTWNNAKKY